MWGVVVIQKNEFIENGIENMIEDRYAPWIDRKANLVTVSVEKRHDQGVKLVKTAL